MRSLLPSLLLLLCLSAHALTAAEPASQAEAKALVDQAQAALVESDTKPERIIDAALGFAAALPWQPQVEAAVEVAEAVVWPHSPPWQQP
jgi:hypothetical protein